MCAVINKYDIHSIKNIVDGIHKRCRGNIWHNFYDWMSDKTYCGVHEKDSLVFWFRDGTVVRGYFYSDKVNELAALLAYLPKGCIVEYLTRNAEKELQEIFTKAGLKQIYEMHRMSEAGITPAKRKIIDMKLAKLRRHYREETVRVADLSDLDMVYQKLYEVFDARMGHLPTKELLKEYIQKGWVIVYCEDNDFLGLYIFIVQKGGAHYGYQIWNEGGPMGYFSLLEKGKEVYEAYILERGYDIAKVPAAYGWVNANNHAAVSVVKARGRSFDGLYDFVYEKYC